jgi:hypothetical protein
MAEMTWATAESTATTEATGTFCEATSPGTLATTGMLAAVGTPATPIRSPEMSPFENPLV